MILICSVVILAVALTVGFMHVSRQRHDRQSQHQQQLLLKAIREFV